MNCLKCGGEVSTSLMCLQCETQYELIEKPNTTGFINYPIMNTEDYTINPEDEYIQW